MLTHDITAAYMANYKCCSYDITIVYHTFSIRRIGDYEFTTILLKWKGYSRSV